MRIRTIKPEFWTDKRVASWDVFTRLFFIGLWSAADDYGRGSAEPARLAAELFPYDLSRDCRETLANVSQALATLSEESRITLYEVSGEHFFEVNTWDEHQRVDHKGKSRIPAPCDPLARLSRDSRETVAPGTGNREQGTGNREQGSGSGASAPQRASGHPSSVDEAKAYFRSIGGTDDEAAHFFDHFESNGWKVGGKTKMKDWQAAARNWRRNGDAFKHRNGHPQPSVRSSCIAGGDLWDEQQRQAVARVESGLEEEGFGVRRGSPPKDPAVGDLG